MNKTRIAVLASGTGTNLQAILDACDDGALDAEVVAVVSNKVRAYCLSRAEDAGVPAIVHSWKPYKEDGATREDYDAALARLVDEFEPDIIVLAGWMWLLSMAFLGRFSNKVINLHPALPGTLPGVDAIQRAFDAYTRGDMEHTGVMVHYVPDEGVDDGPVICTEEIEIFPDDTLASLEERIHQVERRLLIKAIRDITIQFQLAKERF